MSQQADDLRKRVRDRYAAAATAVTGGTPATCCGVDADGTVQVVFSVDLFNEGIDVPTVDTVLMLRPTESPTLFLQQLGRGLRKSPGKSFCTIRIASASGTCVEINTIRKFAATKAIAYSSVLVRCARNSVWPGKL